jgi:diaminopimelate decarboxylase
MAWLELQHGVLHAEGVSLAQIARDVGTPTFVYSRASIREAYLEFAQGCEGRNALICYALKANSNLAVIAELAALGAGFDIVSGGELERVLAAGGRPDRVVFSGVGKTEREMVQALQAGVRCFNVESESELRRLSAVATRLGKTAAISLRVNPDVDAKTHPYISTGLKENKFGVAHDQALRVYREALKLPGLAIHGIDCHIGSQITELAPFLAAIDKVLELVDGLAQEGIVLHHLDLGGGLGIRYCDETPPERAALMQAVFAKLDTHPRARGMEVMFEFGRSIVGNAGVLLTEVVVLKQNGERHYAVVDAAMNDLMRPAMYQAYHEVLEVRPGNGPRQVFDVVGPVCESGDWLARQRQLSLQEGDLLALASAGAYGMAMSSNYNTRGRAAEVMVDEGRSYVVRDREDSASLFALERRLPSHQ